MATTDLTKASYDGKGDIWNIEIQRGDTYEFDGVIKNEPETEGEEGLPFDLTDFLMVCGVKRNRRDSEYIAFWQVSIIVPQEEGRFRLKLTNSESMKLAGGVDIDDAASLYFWDCKLYTAGKAFVRTVWYGDHKVLRNVTDA